ncbi:MAG: CAP domain-containing protein [Candidatus Kapabacteria bacterium]|nr:CAP domain-containing protein [Candidatus Kapabacteria bacterium]
MKYLLSIVTILAFATIAYAAKPNIKAIEQEVLERINAYRLEQGLQPLVLNSTVSEIARKHSANMASGKVAFGHDGFLKRDEKIRAKLVGILKTGENVAWGKNVTVQRIVEDWIASPHHHENIVEPNYRETGIGVAVARNGRIYYTQLFVF